MFRNNKFKQSVFSIEDIDIPRMNASTTDFQRNPSPITENYGAHPIAQSYDTLSFHPPPQPQNLGGTKEAPVSLKPVRISSAHSLHSHDIRSSFSKSSLKEEAPQMMNPSNNPYYIGAYHGPNLMGVKRGMGADGGMVRGHQIEFNQNDRTWHPPQDKSSH